MLLEAIRFERPLRGIRLVIDGQPRPASEDDGAGGPAIERERQAAEVAAAREAGYRQGRTEADAAFTEQLMTQRQEVIGLAEGVLRKLADQHDAMTAQARGCVPDLVMNIVRRVLAGIESNAGQVQRIIEQALAETPQGGEQPLEVLLSPADLALLESMNAAELREKHPRVTLRADPALAPGDCLVRGKFGMIDARLETKLQAVEQLLVTH